MKAPRCSRRALYDQEFSEWRYAGEIVELVIPLLNEALVPSF